jgi:hypothetical protein
MTAAIRPACCAGADRAKSNQELHRIGRADRGNSAVADADAGIAGVGAIGLANADVFAVTDTNLLTDTNSNLLAIADTNTKPDNDADANSDLNADAAP